MGITFAGRGEQLLAALQKDGNPVAQRFAKLLSRTCGNNRNLHYFLSGGKNFAGQNGPRFGVQKWTPISDLEETANAVGHRE